MLGVHRIRGRPASSRVHEQGNDEENQEEEEKHLGDSRGGGRNAAEAEDGGDDRDDKEKRCPVKHLDLHMFRRDKRSERTGARPVSF